MNESLTQRPLPEDKHIMILDPHLYQLFSWKVGVVNIDEDDW